MSAITNTTTPLRPKTYLGTKGYTIYKNTLTPLQLTKIRKDLTVKPFSPTASSFGPAANIVTYPIYLEDTKNPKIYVPYFYGLREFGTPQETKITDGIEISPHHATYTGYALRPQQQIVARTYLDHVHAPANAPKAGGLLELHTGFGKTLVANYLMSQLRRKTLIVVHTEFLMGQWQENIERALPHARIGTIQGEKVDITDKDIVIGMLQSLSQKNYPQEVFNQFGLLIIDEVHHISSEVFSRILAKITTKYSLGLSATMDRADRTTWVIKAYMGDIVYSIKKREIDYGVVVRGIEYRVPDVVYANVKHDFKGNPLYSCMITAVCEHQPRSDFIVDQILGALVENPKQQIMVLAHNRALLEYFHRAIRQRSGELHERMRSAAADDTVIHPVIDEKVGNLVGYYLGGMKMADLKISEGKTVILATYAMAAEALDIKTLTTLFLATSKSNVIQSIGRILRDKNESSPVVYDIIDTHPVFKNQWARKRIPFYRGEKYQIMLRRAGQTDFEVLDGGRGKGGKKGAAAVAYDDDDDDNKGGIKDRSVCMF